MKKVTKLFMNIKAKQDWLAYQKGWKLIHTNGVRYTFVESSSEYNYEYMYFDKSKKELDDIRNYIIDSDIEFVCNSSSWALFRKDTSKGKIQIYTDNYIKYMILMKKYNSYLALGSCYLCLGSSHIAIASTINSLLGLSSALFYLCSSIFFITSYYFKKYALYYDDGSYADRKKKGK